MGLEGKKQPQMASWPCPVTHGEGQVELKLPLQVRGCPSTPRLALCQQLTHDRETPTPHPPMLQLCVVG